MVITNTQIDYISINPLYLSEIYYRVDKNEDGRITEEEVKEVND